MNTMVNKSDREMLIRIEERLKTVQSDIKSIFKTLEGNGKEGLTNMTNRHDSEIQDLSDDIKNVRTSIQWMVGISLTITLVAIGVVKFLR